jgi:hypothetical protein
LRFHIWFFWERENLSAFYFFYECLFHFDAVQQLKVFFNSTNIFSFRPPTLFFVISLRRFFLISARCQHPFALPVKGSHSMLIMSTRPSIPLSRSFFPFPSISTDR